jgi:4-hydroxy-tetrahydrodipicolinate synthase
MTVHTWPAGLLTALVTPLHKDEIDRGSLERLVQYQIDNGANGLIVSGGTGEYSALSFEERRRLIGDVVVSAASRIPVIAATGCLSTRDAINLSQHAQAVGVKGILVVSPYGEPISWRERYAYYAAVAASVTVPMMIYNTPPAGLLNFEQIKQLAELEHVSAVKDSSGDAELMGDLVTWAKPRHFGVYVGKDSFLYEAITMGATGAVFGAANFLPSELSKLIGMLQTSGGTLESLELWSRVRPLLRLMEQASNYVGLCKTGCKVRGLDVGEVRPPYLMPEADEVQLLMKSLERLAETR